ncbi:hypothetical protein FRC10_008057 [Ceratobasidium sp. 414]|nr:hypothetical protein FRC10_008057 [Ceratobasidium sp. 414]
MPSAYAYPATEYFFCNFAVEEITGPIAPTLGVSGISISDKLLDVGDLPTRHLTLMAYEPSAFDSGTLILSDWTLRATKTIKVLAHPVLQEGHEGWKRAPGSWQTVAQKITLNDAGKTNGSGGTYLDGKNVHTVDKASSFFGRSGSTWVSLKDQQVYFADFSLGVLEAE